MEKYREYFVSDKVLNELREKKFVCISGAFEADFINSIVQDVHKSPFNINNHGINGVYLNRQYYSPHLLSLSKNYVDLVTCKELRHLCQSYLSSKEIRLKNQRYYETYGGHPQSWHTDDFAFGRKVKDRGLVFVIYMDNTDEGEFQLVKNTIQWSETFKSNNYSDQSIINEHPGAVVSFPAPKGSLIIFDSKLVHRAKPVKRRNFVRKSILFHIDEGLENGEELLINPELINSPDAETLQLLGFGNTKVFSNLPSNINSLPMNKLFSSLPKSYPLQRSLRFWYELTGNSRMVRWIKGKSKTLKVR